jgi:hypothetical protein
MCKVDAASVFRLEEISAPCWVVERELHCRELHCAPEVVAPYGARRGSTSGCAASPYAVALKFPALKILARVMPI